MFMQKQVHGALSNLIPLRKKCRQHKCQFSNWKMDEQNPFHGLLFNNKRKKYTYTHGVMESNH